MSLMLLLPAAAHAELINHCRDSHGSFISCNAYVESAQSTPFLHAFLALWLLCGIPWGIYFAGGEEGSGGFLGGFFTFGAATAFLLAIIVS